MKITFKKALLNSIHLPVWPIHCILYIITYNYSIYPDLIVKFHPTSLLIILSSTEYHIEVNLLYKEITVLFPQYHECITIHIYTNVGEHNILYTKF